MIKRIFRRDCGRYRRHRFAEWAGLNVAICDRCGCVYVADRKMIARYPQVPSA